METGTKLPPQEKYFRPLDCCAAHANYSQTWLDFLQSNNYEMSAMKKAYHLSCVQHNINQRARNGVLCPLHFVPRDAIRQERGLLVDPEENFDIGKSFPFQRLIDEAPEIARKIAIMTMKKSSVVHFVARLDVTEPYPPPEGGRCRVTNLPMRFWWGPGRKVHINSAPTFEDTLAPCHVSRDFMEIFGTTFWSQNKFAFASFGELNIFRRNTRTSYIQRIQSVQIWWQASRGDYPIDWDPESKDHFDRRTWPLSILTAMHRLKSLEVYVDESSEKAKRRAKEPQFVQNPLLDATRGQDNNRTYRDLRKLQGMDYVYQLRNLKMVRFYDSAQADRGVEVRDESFVKDVRQQVTQPKSRRRGREAKFENLKPMLRRNLAEEPLYIAKAPVKWVVKSMFYPTLPWNPAKYPDPEQAADSGNGGGGGGGGRGGDEDGGHEDVGGYRALEDNGETGHQGEGDDSNSDSSSDSDPDPDSLFRDQGRNNSVVTQEKGFQGRRAVSMDASGTLDNGFGRSLGNNSQLFGRSRSIASYGQGPFIDDDSDDENVVVVGYGSAIVVDDNDDDDVMIDEERSAPRPGLMWGQHFDLTGDRLKKENDDDEDMPDAASPNSQTTGQPNAANAGAVEPESDPTPKPDEDASQNDIYGVTPSIDDRDQPVPAGGLQSPILDVPDLTMAALHVGPPADNDEVQIVRSNFVGFGTESGPIVLDDDDDNQQSNGQAGVPDVVRYIKAEEVKVKKEDETALLSTPANAMREAANLGRNLGQASRETTPSFSGGTPTSSLLAAEKALFNSFNFGSPSPSPSMGTPRPINSHRGSSYSSDGSRSIRCTTWKRSREEDGSTPTPGIDKRASKSRRPSRSYTAGGATTATMARGIDELDLGGQIDGAGDSLTRAS